MISPDAHHENEYATPRQRVEVLGWKGIPMQNPPGPPGVSISLIQD